MAGKMMSDAEFVQMVTDWEEAQNQWAWVNGCLTGTLREFGDIVVGRNRYYLDADGRPAVASVRSINGPTPVAPGTAEILSGASSGQIPPSATGRCDAYSESKP